MRIFIDTMTGTWGMANDIVVIEVEDGAEAAMLCETLDGLSDSGICEYGNTYGDSIFLSDGI